MKRHIYALCITLMGVFLYSSCLGSDSNYEVATYDDMAITGFSLSAANRYIHTTSKKTGNDTIYKEALTTKPTFTIDQTLYKIYNTDSLPKDCDLKHVLATISSSTYSGSIVIKSVNSDTLYNYSSTDSIDFSQPREIRVYNNTLEKYRTYEVTLNQHQVETGTILWEKMPAESYPVNTEKEKWEKLVTDAGLKSFIGAGTKEAYAFSQDGRIMVTKDEGATWTPDSLDEDISLLPKQDIAFVSYPFAPNEKTDYQLLAGIIEEGEVISVVWRKIAEYGEDSQACKWVYLPYEEYNRYYLPATPSLNLVYFHDKVLAISADMIRASQDGGITWHTSDQFTLPDEGDTHFQNVEAVTDDEGALWFKDKDTNEVWRGVLVE